MTCVAIMIAHCFDQFWCEIFEIFLVDIAYLLSVDGNAELFFEKIMLFVFSIDARNCIVKNPFARRQATKKCSETED